MSALIGVTDRDAKLGDEAEGEETRVVAAARSAAAECAGKRPPPGPGRARATAA